MGDYWRFAERDARLAAIPPAAKRSRSDFDNMAPPTRLDMTGGSYLPREESRYDGRDVQAPWRDVQPLGGTDLMRDAISYGASGLSGTSFSGPPGLQGMGLSVAGSGGLGSMSISVLDESALKVQGPRIMGIDASLGKSANLAVNGARQETSVRAATDSLPPDASATLFVEGLPSDCVRREAAHVFRPFIGFKEVRLVPKEPKRPGGDKLILCFVEFADARCASIALEALQGYKFDETDRESTSLRLQFARFSGPRGQPQRTTTLGALDRDDIYGLRGIRR